MPHAPQSDVLRGTIELLVLKTLALTPMHGWGIGQRIQQISKGALEVNQGSLYPALQRLEHQGLITSAWGPSESNRRARYYRLTAKGRRQLDHVESKFGRLIGAIARVMTPADGTS